MSHFKTPLRYPGGKQRIAPFIEEILSENNINGHYVEPYAGGAGVGIELLLTNKVDHIHLNDSDSGIYSFWFSLLNRTDELCSLISSASMTVDEWKNRKEIVKNCDTNNILELGFSVFYLNRCNRSGVLKAGLIGGLEQKGNYKMDARFSRNDLIKRIESIALFKDKISISNLDAEYYIEEYIPKLPSNTLIYLDPPYYKKGGGLYLNAYKKNDHARLSEVIQNEIKHKWILSYDGVPDIINLYLKRRHFLYDLQYTAATVYKGKEIFVFCDSLKLPQQCSLKHIDIGIKNLIYN
jgi:DNA adenine methylase